MKKVITFVSILCIGCILFCGCGKKDKDSNKSGANTSESVDGVAVDDMGEETVVVDFDTGSIISVPSNKNEDKNDSNNETSSSSATTEIVTEAGEPSLGSSNTPSSSSSKAANSSSSSSSSSNASSQPSTPSEGSSSDSVMGGFSPWE